MADVITIQLEEADFIEAYRPARRQGRIANLVLILAAVLGLLVLALVIRFPEARQAFKASPIVAGLTGAIALGASLVTALLLAAPMLRRRAARSTLVDHPGMTDPVTYSFDADRFSVCSTFTQASYPWGQLWDWRETERVIIVLPTPRNFYVLPKRGVDLPALERLRGHLAKTRKRDAR